MQRNQPISKIEKSFLEKNEDDLDDGIIDEKTFNERNEIISKFIEIKRKELAKQTVMEFN